MRNWKTALILGVWLTAWAASGPAAEPGDAPVRDFAALHISDIHVGPHLARSGPPEALRGAATIRWVCEQAGQPQDLTPYERKTPAASFVLATGDITEYGVIDDTWQVVESAFKGLPCPLYVVPGNHDNTWTALYAVMRARYGGENYSFDQGGCHFICLSSAAPQDPNPCLDAKTRTWLKADLEKTGIETPVFVALHHPPYSSEFANPAEVGTLVDLLRDYNVVLLLYGHGHSAEARDVDGIPGVMGGSTYGKNAGYGVLSVRGDAVRYAYRFEHDPNLPNDKDAPAAWRPLFEANLRAKRASRLFKIEEPRERVAAEGPRLAVRLAAGDAPLPEDGLLISYRIDGKEIAASSEPPGATVDLPVADLEPGGHLLTVIMRLPDHSRDTRARVFYTRRSGTEVVWRRQLPAAVKAGPVMAGKELIIARNDGIVMALDPQDGQERWTFTTGAEILGTPAWSGDMLVFGSGDGKVYALDGAGHPRWTFDAERPVYGPPRIAGETVYIGDNGGRMHALKLADGTQRWVFERADFSIECQPAVWNDALVFGAWDGYLYAVDRGDGKLRWKTYGPKSAEGGAARYYAPADCGPVPLGETLFVCDRGYQLGLFSPAGTLQSRLPFKASAIAPAADGRSFYARSTEDRVARLDEKGATIWDVAVAAGRFPIPPTESGGKVYVCSNRGRLSALDARDGSVVWTYQVTPGLYVMAPVAVAEGADGTAATCYVAGMDGSLTALRSPAASTAATQPARTP